jgi:hypothetical protein
MYLLLSGYHLSISQVATRLHLVTLWKEADDGLGPTFGYQGYHAGICPPVEFHKPISTNCSVACSSSNSALTYPIPHHLYKQSQPIGALQLTYDIYLLQHPDG